MKWKLLKWFSVVAFGVAVFPACTREDLPGDDCPHTVHTVLNGGKITFVINIPGQSDPNPAVTRAITEGTPADNRVDDATILLFDPDNGDKYSDFVQPSSIEQVPGESNRHLKRFTVMIPPGEWKSLVLVNWETPSQEINGKSIATYLTENKATLETSTISDLAGNLSYWFNQWNADTTHVNYKPFIMGTRYDIPVIRTAMQTLYLTRMLAKINVKFANPTVSSNFALKEIHLCNYNRRGLAIPGSFGTSPSIFNASHLNLPLFPDKALGYANAVVYSSSAFKNNECVDEIFLNEVAALSDQTNWKDNVCLLIKGELTGEGDRWFRVNFRLKDPGDGNTVKHVNFLRNFRYTINIKSIEGTHPGHATAEEAYNHLPEGMTVDIDAIDETGMNDVTYNGQHQLVIDKSEFVFLPPGGDQTIRAFTDHPGGWKIENVTGSIWNTAPAAGLSKPVNSTVSTPITCTANTGGTIRNGTFTITAGPLRKTIYVQQLPSSPTITQLPNSYVGAFWRANERGERLIRIQNITGSNIGNWTAYVSWMDARWSAEDIMLNTEPVSDGGITWNATTENPGNAENFNFFGGQTVSGTVASGGEIYFRIGLKGAYSATGTYPARYAVVILAYNLNGTPKYHRIFLRQGEGADYLMRPGDPGGIRLHTVQFSPYNLTAKDGIFNAGLPLRGGVFTDYPTQAGAYFQWANINNRTRYAWDPMTSSVSPAWEVANPAVTAFWRGGSNPLSETHETCPDGYTRPSDGIMEAVSAAGGVANSEFRQSLWVNPPTGTAAAGNPNVVFGYYADGWFDRRLIQSAPGGGAVAAVAPTTSGVAYAGGLFYNPTNYASLFFPAAGIRTGFYGTFNVTGESGYYLSSSTQLDGDSNPANRRIWALRVSNAVNAADVGRHYDISVDPGYSVRCVECTAVESVSLHYGGPGSVDVGQRINLVAGMLPASANKPRYLWEYNWGDGWVSIPSSAANPNPGDNNIFRAPVSIVGPQSYRVTAYNGCGSAMSSQIDITGTLFPGIGDVPNIQTYIGAFWKDNQSGERVIRFNVGTGLRNSGLWMASVAWYDGKWDPYNTSSPDRVVLANSASVSLPLSGSAESYPVVDGTRIISGTVSEGGIVTFKIGLDKHYTAYNSLTDPARYAVVLLSYGDNGNADNDPKLQKIFIRQGGGDDYVMRPGDPGTGVPTSPTVRPSAVRFLPYNVTDQSGNITSNYGSGTIITPSNSTLTDFPTKAGYFFIYRDNRAIAPDNPTGALSAWNNNIGGNNTNHWNTAWESCPTGYRRPDDNSNPGTNGSNGTFNTTGSIAGSEIRQSLWLNPPAGTGSNTDNSVWGYYADGYFDRMALQSALGGGAAASSAVTLGLTPPQAAYIGRLFFNPNTNASLFFPSAGYRFNQTGLLHNAGLTGHYWTRTSYSTTHAWFLMFYSSTTSTDTGLAYDMGANSNSKTSGAMVRCVKIP